MNIQLNYSNWHKASVLNEIVQIYSDIYTMMSGMFDVPVVESSGFTTHQNIVVGDNIQSADFWNGLVDYIFKFRSLNAQGDIDLNGDVTNSTNLFCTCRVHSFMNLYFSKPSILNSGDNLQQWIHNEFIPKTIAYFESLVLHLYFYISGTLDGALPHPESCYISDLNVCDININNRSSSIVISQLGTFDRVGVTTLLGTDDYLKVDGFSYYGKEYAEVDLGTAPCAEKYGRHKYFKNILFGDILPSNKMTFSLIDNYRGDFYISAQLTANITKREA